MIVLWSIIIKQIEGYVHAVTIRMDYRGYVQDEIETTYSKLLPVMLF